jgi:hypothetical protein
MLIGFTGLVGALTKFISPITVSSLMLLLVISSVDLSVQRIEKHWVAIMYVFKKFLNMVYRKFWADFLISFFMMFHEFYHFDPKFLKVILCDESIARIFEA